MLSKFFVLLTAAFLSQSAFSKPAPISEKEYKFLMALNVFGAPGVSQSKLRAARGLGCVDKSGNFVKPNTEKVIDGFELTCMLRSKPKDSDEFVYIWFPSRFAHYCKDFASFDECAAVKAEKNN